MGNALDVKCLNGLTHSGMHLFCARMKGEWDGHCLYSYQLWRLIRCWIALRWNVDKCGLISQIGYDTLKFRYLGALFSYHAEIRVLQCVFSVLGSEENVLVDLCALLILLLFYKTIKFSRPWHLSIRLVVDCELYTLARMLL